MDYYILIITLINEKSSLCFDREFGIKSNFPVEILSARPFRQPLNDRGRLMETLLKGALWLSAMVGQPQIPLFRRTPLRRIFLPERLLE